MTRPARALLLKLILASALGGLLLPFLLIVLFGLLDGMLLYVYILFPLISVITGLLAGLEIKRLWFYPLINGFFTIYWLLRASGFQPLVTLQYVGVYILLGAAAMGLCATVRWLVASRGRE